MKTVAFVISLVIVPFLMTAFSRNQSVFANLLISLSEGDDLLRFVLFVALMLTALGFVCNFFYLTAGNSWGVNYVWSDMFSNCIDISFSFPVTDQLQSAA